MKTQTLYTLFLATWSALAAASTQDSIAENTSEIAEEKPYQIVITGKITRTTLRNMIEKVEDDFFARFNELNIEDAYDVHCYTFTPIMTHISERICEPRFAIRTRGQNASEVMYGLMQEGVDTINAAQNSVWLMNPQSIQKEVKPDFETLQQKLEDFTRTDEDFRQIGNVLAELKYRLENFSDQ